MEDVKERRIKIKINDKYMRVSILVLMEDVKEHYSNCILY